MNTLSCISSPTVFLTIAVLQTWDDFSKESLLNGKTHLLISELSYAYTING
jgi:hypothetical protein